VNLLGRKNLQAGIIEHLVDRVIIKILNPFNLVLCFLELANRFEETYLYMIDYSRIAAENNLKSTADVMKFFIDFIADDATVAATYVKNGGQVMKHEIQTQLYLTCVKEECLQLKKIFINLELGKSGIQLTSLVVVFLGKH